MCGSLYDKYIHVQKSIEEIVEGNESESSHAAYPVEFKNEYFNIISAIKDFIEDVRACQKREKNILSLRSITPLSHTQQQSPVILLQINLLIFYGSVKD